MSETATPPKRPGQPKKITRKVMEQILTMLAHGLTEVQIAEILKLNRVTVWRAKQERQFCNMVLRAKDEADLQVVKSLYLRATGYTHPEEKLFCHEGEIIRAETQRHYPPDVGAITLWLINRKREEWRKEIQHEESRPFPPMIRLFSKLNQDEITVVNRGENQVDVLLGKDFVDQVKEKNGVRQAYTNGNGTNGHDV